MLTAGVAGAEAVVVCAGGRAYCGVCSPRAEAGGDGVASTNGVWQRKLRSPPPAHTVRGRRKVLALRAQ
jgi:hypothetical protein